jgi:hypothetical protein
MVLKQSTHSTKRNKKTGEKSGWRGLYSSSKSHDGSSFFFGTSAGGAAASGAAAAAGTGTGGGGSGGDTDRAGVGAALEVALALAAGFGFSGLATGLVPPVNHSG